MCGVKALAPAVPAVPAVPTTRRPKKARALPPALPSLLLLLLLSLNLVGNMKHRQNEITLGKRHRGSTASSFIQ